MPYFRQGVRDTVVNKVNNIFYSGHIKSQSTVDQCDSVCEKCKVTDKYSLFCHFISLSYISV